MLPPIAYGHSSHLVTYILHYIIARGLFQVLRSNGVPLVAMVVVAGVCLFLWNRRRNG